MNGPKLGALGVLSDTFYSARWVDTPGLDKKKEARVAAWVLGVVMPNLASVPAGAGTEPRCSDLLQTLYPIFHNYVGLE